MVRLMTSMLLLLVLALADLSSVALAKDSSASAEEKVTTTVEAEDEEEAEASTTVETEQEEATTTAEEEKEEATTTVEAEKEEVTTTEAGTEETTTAEEEKEDATTTAKEKTTTTDEEKDEATTTVEAEKEEVTTTEAGTEETTTAEEEKEEATTTEEEKQEEATTTVDTEEQEATMTNQEKEETPTAEAKKEETTTTTQTIVSEEDEASTSPDMAGEESTTAKEKQESSHGGAYTAEVVEDIVAHLQKGRIRANWVVEKGERLQICGIEDQTECMQTQVTDVEKVGDDDGEDEFRIKFWPPSATLIKKKSPINKAGTDSTPKSPGWQNENCSILDISLDGKYYASPQKTRSCRSLLTSPEKLFEKFKIPKMAGHGALVMSLVGSMAMIAGVVSLVVASRRAANRWRQGVGYEAVCTPRQPDTRDINWVDVEADTNGLE